jgi:ketopantoate reductase
VLRVRLAILGPSRTVFAFPGIAGYSDDAVIRYVDIPQQHTAVEERAPDVASLFRGAGFRVNQVRDMDAWLQRHAVFIAAIAGALYESDCDARLWRRMPKRYAASSLACGKGGLPRTARG